MARKITLEIVCTFLIVLFLYAAVSKLLDYQGFYIKLGRSPFIGSFAGLIAWAIPLSEIIAAILLAFPKTRRAGLVCSFTLMLAFSLYVSLVLSAAKKIPCTCGGLLQSMSWQQHLYFNITVTTITLITLFAHMLQNTGQETATQDMRLSRSH